MLYFDESHDLLDKRTLDVQVPNAPDTANEQRSASDPLQNLLHLCGSGLFRGLSLDELESEPLFTIFREDAVLPLTSR